MSKDIKILFGEMGGGKNYWGEKIAQDNGYTFLDGDTLATPEMINRVSQFKSMTRKMIIEYIDKLTIAISEQARQANNGLVVAQALYFDEDRKIMRYALTHVGFNVQFIWVKTPFWRNLNQIFSRPEGFKWSLYWLANKPFFQKPTHPHTVIK